MLRYLTAGESHGKGIIAILDGMPAGLKVDLGFINQELNRRQAGFGRGKRMRLEEDRPRILSGLKKDKTLGSPIAILIENKDVSIEKSQRITCPRPGHADLAGLLKYGFSDIGDVLERASARSTAATVAIGALAKILLTKFKIKVFSKVLLIGGKAGTAAIKEKIAEAMNKKDTVGGIFQVSATGVPAGLGSYAQPQQRLDARLAQAIISIPGVKGVEFGLGFGFAFCLGSELHDAIYHSKTRGYFRKTNNAGGIEGGISNGEDIIIRACMKPVSTLLRPLDSVNVATKKPAKAFVVRSDTCVAEAAGVIAESAVALVLADSLLEKFGSDSLSDIVKAYGSYVKRIR